MTEYINNMRKYIGHERLLIVGASVFIHKGAICSCKREKITAAGPATAVVWNLAILSKKPHGANYMKKRGLSRIRWSSSVYFPAENWITHIQMAIW